MQDYFCFLTTYLPTLLFPISSLSSSNRWFVAVEGDGDIMQRKWLPGGKVEMGPIA